MVANNIAEALDRLGVDGHGLRGECRVQGNLGQDLVIAKPETPVKVLDALVATVDNLVDGGETHLGLVQKVQSQRDRHAASLLVEHEFDLAVGVCKLDRFEVGRVATE